jgi:hypothetical protein
MVNIYEYFRSVSYEISEKLDAMNPIIFLILIGAFNCALSVDLSPKVLTAEQANSGVVLIPSLSAIESNSSELVPVANVEGQIST